MTMFDLLPYFGFADVMYLDIIYVHTYLLLFFKWENKSLYKLRTCVQKHDQVVLPNMPYLFDDDYLFSLFSSELFGKESYIILDF